jgi:hypothetical protein
LPGGTIGKIQHSLERLNRATIQHQEGGYKRESSKDLHHLTDSMGEGESCVHHSFQSSNRKLERILCHWFKKRKAFKGMLSIGSGQSKILGYVSSQERVGTIRGPLRPSREDERKGEQRVPPRKEHQCMSMMMCHPSKSIDTYKAIMNGTGRRRRRTQDK